MQITSYQSGYQDKKARKKMMAKASQYYSMRCYGDFSKHTSGREQHYCRGQKLKYFNSGGKSHLPWRLTAFTQPQWHLQSFSH
jgi:hypothetical protein